MSEIKEVRYLTDDRDLDEKTELVIFPGGNDDWYVGVVPEGQGYIGKTVRICTSGGASSRVPGLAPAIANAHRALLSAGENGGVTHKQMNDEPLCNISGRCEAPQGAHGTTNCIHCGKELHERDGLWWTWDADMFP